MQGGVTLDSDKPARNARRLQAATSWGQTGVLRVVGKIDVRNPDGSIAARWPRSQVRIGRLQGHGSVARGFCTLLRTGSLCSPFHRGGA
jgi:hypothetical protein